MARRYTNQPIVECRTDKERRIDSLRPQQGPHHLSRSLKAPVKWALSLRGARAAKLRVTDLTEYFERQKQRCERELKYAETAGFKLCEKTAQGARDITQEHIQQLCESRDEYQRMIDYLKNRTEP